MSDRPYIREPNPLCTACGRATRVAGANYCQWCRAPLYKPTDPEPTTETVIAVNDFISNAKNQLSMLQPEERNRAVLELLAWSGVKVKEETEPTGPDTTPEPAQETEVTGATEDGQGGGPEARNGDRDLPTVLGTDDDEEGKE